MSTSVENLDRKISGSRLHRQSAGVRVIRVRKVAAQPMEPHPMTSVARDVIDNDPEIVLQEQHRPRMNAASGVTAIAEMRADSDRPVRVVLEPQEAGVRSIQHLELPEMEHLI